MGDIRPHFHGVKGIELPQFPHLRHTEAGDQCDQCCPSVPLFHSVRHASNLSSLFIQPFIYPKSLLIPPFFYALLHFPPFLSRLLCFSLVNQTLSHVGLGLNAPGASRITCRLPAITSPLITIQSVSDVLLGHR